MHKLAKTIPIILGGLILTLTLVISVLSVTNKNLTFKSKTKAAGAEVKLAITPSRFSINIGEKSTFGVTLETNEQSVQGVDLKIKYDPVILDIDEGEIVKGTFLERVLVKKIEKGVISYSAVTSSPKTINAILLSISFKAKGTGTTRIEFIAPTLVLESSTVKNILDKTESSEITVR